MWINDIDFFDSPTISQSASEDDEALKASIAASIAWVKRTRSDEKKSRSYDEVLTLYLRRILNSANESERQFASCVSNTLKLWAPSFLVVSYIALLDEGMFVTLFPKSHTSSLHTNASFDVFMHAWAPAFFSLLASTSILQSQKLHFQLTQEAFRLSTHELFVQGLMRYNLSPEALREYHGFLMREMEKYLEAYTKKNPI